MTDEHDPAQYAEPDTGEMPAEDVEAMNKTLPMILSFLVVPLLIVIVATGVLMAFGMATYEDMNPQRLVEMLQGGSANRRWQAAFELAKLIGQDPERLREQQLAPALLDVFADTSAETEEGRTVRRYLALGLGSLGDPVAIAPLRAALDDPDSETRIYVITALGQLGAVDAAPDLIALLSDEDPGIAKAAAYGLGAMPAAAGAADALVPVLDHGVADVRWNAALSLAKLGDIRAESVLRDMLDRGAVAGVPDILPEQVEDVMTSAIRSAVALRLDDLEPMLTALAEADPNLRVRDAAYQGLEALRTQPEAWARDLRTTT